MTRQQVQRNRLRIYLTRQQEHKSQSEELSERFEKKD